MRWLATQWLRYSGCQVISADSGHQGVLSVLGVFGAHGVIHHDDTVSIVKMTATAVYGRAESRNLSIEGCLPLTVVFHWRLSSIEGRLPSKVIFHHKGLLPLKVVFIEVHLPSKVVFHHWSSSIEGHLPSKIVFYQRLSSIEGLPPL